MAKNSREIFIRNSSENIHVNVVGDETRDFIIADTAIYRLNLELRIANTCTELKKS